MGAPIGNQNAAKAKRWSAAIERALERRGLAGQQGLDQLADQFIEDILSAKKDSVPGWRELGDRLEGKPAQVIAGDPENPLQLVGRVELVALK